MSVLNKILASSGDDITARAANYADDAALAKYLADVDEYNAISGIVDNSVRNVDRGLVDDFMSSLDPYDVQRGNIKLKRFAPLDYQTGHTPDISGPLLSNITDDNLGYVGDDFFEHPHYYNATPEQADIVRRFDGNPEELVTIYRATDAGDQINPYDWVTLQEEYAREHLMNNLGGKGKVLKQQVPARDVRFAGDDFAEFGYFPTYIE